MIKIFCDPLNQTIQAINELYPDLETQIQYNPDIDTNECVGYTIFPCKEDMETEGNIKIPVIEISPVIPYMAVVEVLSHEVAHVVVGDLPEGEDEHGEKWKTVMDKIEKKYIEIGYKEMESLESGSNEKAGHIRYGFRDDIVIPGGK